jgi:branched-chain amino acid transport system substrate-binding protein
MHVIYEALKKTAGKADGDSLLAAIKGMKWTSPRGPVSIDDNRELVQNIYIRKVEKSGSNIVNVEFDTVKDVKAK